MTHYISEEEAEDYRMERKMLRNPPPEEVCAGCGEPQDAPETVNESLAAIGREPVEGGDYLHRGMPGEYCETCVEARQERDRPRVEPVVRLADARTHAALREWPTALCGIEWRSKVPADIDPPITCYRCKAVKERMSL